MLKAQKPKWLKLSRLPTPEITVDFQLLPYADYFTSLKTWIAGGTAPDVASLDLSMLQEMAAAGSIADLNPMIKADGYDLSQYYQSTLDMFQNNGGQYGLPAFLFKRCLVLQQEPL